MLDNNREYRNFDKYPEKKIDGFTARQGWAAVREAIESCRGGRKVITAEFYPGVNREEIVSELAKLGITMYDAEECAISDREYHELIDDFLTEDRVFGIMNTLTLEEIYNSTKIEELRERIRKAGEPVIIYGVGASLVTEGDTLLYFDMPRWELQCRFQEGMSNWKTDNPGEDKLRKFKQGYFVEWRMADRHKRKLLDKLDFILDTVVRGEPGIVSGDGFRKGLCTFAREPFRLVPYYASEVWGGQWMKEICGLEREKINYAWAFDGVPEENSIYMRFGDVRMEFPSIDVVFYRPKELLGSRVYARFGDDFPIRFDFLDTMEGQNLSLQVHPLTEYIQNTFGMHYTQDESYYILDCSDDSVIYLGLKEGTDRDGMLRELRKAQEGEAFFDAERYVNVWKAKKHDHFLIPAGTVHCSGRNTMVLEISATPYIFTFKLWDWGRLGLDGRPRPVHIDHGARVIQWDRTTQWVKENLINNFELICREPGYSEERTGLHRFEFIETHRYHLTGIREYDCEDGVSMCNVVDGKGAVVSSPENAFEPFEVHYAETFILPASLKSFALRPLGGECMVLRATIR
jgi:mannose-6-phosphate isomerase class I